MWELDCEWIAALLSRLSLTSYGDVTPWLWRRMANCISDEASWIRRTPYAAVLDAQVWLGEA